MKFSTAVLLSVAIRKFTWHFVKARMLCKFINIHKLKNKNLYGDKKRWHEEISLSSTTRANYKANIELSRQNTFIMIFKTIPGRNIGEICNDLRIKNIKWQNLKTIKNPENLFCFTCESNQQKYMFSHIFILNNQQKWRKNSQKRG